MNVSQRNLLWRLVSGLTIVVLGLFPNFALAASANGTRAPQDSFYIYDASGNIWYVENGLSHKNWYPEGGSNVSYLLYYNNTIYAQTYDGSWYYNTGEWHQTSNPMTGGGGGGESASGTTVPSASQIVDSRGVVWTLGNGYSYQNGSHDGGTNIAQLFYINRTVYAYTYANAWYFYQDGWYGTSDPRGNNNGGSGDSADGTTIPSASRIVDSRGVVWTLNGGRAYQNGALEGGANITQLLYKNKTIYANTNGYGWWAYGSNGWQQVSDPNGNNNGGNSESASGTTIPSASRIVDSSGVVWTMSGGYAYKNGAQEGGAITQLLYKNKTIYANTNGYGWWAYNNGWQQVSDPNGNNGGGSGGGGESASGTTVPSASQIVDSRGVVWTLGNGYSYQNGSHDGGTNIARLHYINRVVYAYTNANAWYFYQDGWYGTSDPNGGGTQQPQPQPQPQPTGIALGGCGSCDGGSQGITNVNNFANFLNKNMDYVLVWGWAPTAHDFEYSFQYLDELWPRNYKLHFSVPMIVSETTFADAYNGVYDSSYRTIAQRIAYRDPYAVIRMGHEMNGNWYPWSMDGPAGSAEEFAMAFRHIVTVFRSVSPNFKFTWNPGLGAWAGLDSVRTYPGDAYVDYISLDMYEDSRYDHGTPEERWNAMLNKDGRGLTFWDNFASQHGKPLAFDEWASDYDDGVLIRNMYEWMRTRNVAYQMYWNSNAAFPGSFESHPYNGQVYKQLFGQ